jgi:hypothetical protein
VSDILIPLPSLIGNREGSGVPSLVGCRGIDIAAPVSSVIKILLWREGIPFTNLLDNGGDASVDSISGEVSLDYLLFIELFRDDFLELDILGESSDT